MLAEKFISDVKAAVNLKELAEEYTELVPAGERIWHGKCPHPDHLDTDPSFTVFFNRDNTWSWCCYGCHVGKNIQKGSKVSKGESDCISFIQWLSDTKDDPFNKKKKSFPAAVKELAVKYHIPIQNDPYEKEYKINAIKAKAYSSNIIPEVLEYLYSRGLDESDIKRWKIGFSEFYEYGNDKLIPRIVFPLENRNGLILGSSRRKFGNDLIDVPKYWNTKNSVMFNKGNYLYGERYITDESDYVYITEGVFDVILASKYGLKNVVASLGTSFTENQAKLVKHMTKIPVFCMDGDEAGKKAVNKALTLMANKIGIPARVLILPDGEDLAELALRINDQEKFLEYVSLHTMPYWQYLLSDPSNNFEIELTKLQEKYLTVIKNALNNTESPEDELLLKNYIYKHFQIKI